MKLVDFKHNQSNEPWTHTHTHTPGHPIQALCVEEKQANTGPSLAGLTANPEIISGPSVCNVKETWQWRRRIIIPQEALKPGEAIPLL